MRELNMQEVDQVSGGSILQTVTGALGIDLREAAGQVGRSAVRGAAVGGIFGAGVGAGKTFGGITDRIRGIIGGLRGE